jgi:hypothetical protein
VARVVVASAATTADGLDDGSSRTSGSPSPRRARTRWRRSAASDGERVVVRCVLGVDALEVHIEGIGSGFDSHEPVDVSAPGEQHLDEAAEQGWGLQLIRALVDDVSFSTTAGTAAARSACWSICATSSDSGRRRRRPPGPRRRVARAQVGGPVDETA